MNFDTTENYWERLNATLEQILILTDLMKSPGLDRIVNETLRTITLKTGELLNADRTAIWLLDEYTDQLWTIVPKEEDRTFLELKIPKSAGIMGEAAVENKVINIPYDFYDDPRSHAAQKFDQNNNYRTYSMLLIPLISEETGELVAVVQFINKLKPEHLQGETLDEQIDVRGFTAEDEEEFRRSAPSIIASLACCKSLYWTIQEQRAASALQYAISSLSKSSLDLEDTMKNVMDYAKELTSADRSTLWLIDTERNELWTKIPINSKLTEIRIPRTAGFAGMVAESGEPLLIPFDLYDDERSEKARETDKKCGYRTCTMLCTPVFNPDGELIGVTQLINKTKPGEFPDYDPANWSEPPERWKISFNRNDWESMKAFNVQAGVVLQNALLFDTVKQTDRNKKDIWRYLTHGVISTDWRGNIITANEKARDLLGVSNTEIVEGKPVRQLIQVREGDFAKWLDAAINPTEAKDRQQYYPKLTLVTPGDREPESINLYLNSMADVIDPIRVNGALVVMEDITGEKQVKDLMRRYMTLETTESLLASGDTGLGGKRKHVSVLYSDIRGYTMIAESLTAEEVVAMLNEYFEKMVDAVLKYGGTLDKYIGDALMAVFGSPAPLEDYPWCAIQAAVEMRHRLAALNEERVVCKKMSISIGIGIHSDEVVSGNIGSSQRMELTCIGDAVNIASRLESATKLYGTDIIISENTYSAYKDRLWVRELDLMTVKGKREPIRFYELVGIRKGPLRQPLTPTQQAIIERYHKGREYYLRPSVEAKMSNAAVKECFELAEREFKEVLKVDPENKAAKLHIRRCQLFQQDRPSQSWNGVWSL